MQGGGTLMEELLSVGIDLGTTTTQMVVSRLVIENTASSFSVPRMEIRDREILYRSRVHLTPLLSPERLDAEAIGTILRKEYQEAGIRPEQVRTGAVIITGETARKDNAKEVLSAMSDLAGELVVATAGPALESVLAAKGAGADKYAASNGVRVLHMDIGGGTSNLAVYDAEGALVDTGCVNIGGRLMKFDTNGIVTYRSPVLSGIPCPDVGSRVSDPGELMPMLDILVQVLEEAAGLRPATELLERFITDKTADLSVPAACISFSGGVADLIENAPENWLSYGDLGVLLGRRIRSSRLCSGTYRLGEETLRATVIGAGTHTTELSGSTVFYRNIQFPLRSLPVAQIRSDRPFLPQFQQQCTLYDTVPAFFVQGKHTAYEGLRAFAAEIADTFSSTSENPVLIMETDCAKALGQAVSVRLGQGRGVLCLDGLHIPGGSYLDVQPPIGTGDAVPVIIKTLAFS